MNDTVDYKLFEVPLLGRNIAASRTPRLQPSAIVEYSDMLSREVSAARWTTDPENGEPLNSAGQTIVQHLEHSLKTRPHWLLPTVLEDQADAVWLAEVPNLTVRGARHNQIEKNVGSKAAADILFKEEALRYGVTDPMSLQPGRKPGSDGTEKKPAANLSDNPWSVQYRGDATARAARIASIIKTGTRFAEGMAKAAGTTVGKPLSR
ncbi:MULTISPECIES: hypothetical protein [Bradyrhizobium]|uniref:Uncharacterized protein n=2 Tax=Bradyrhizobium TaxID=374 RepID=A0ABY0PJU2_9BRAD|nr:MULTISPECIES: hypothetical protein [Bradyrhizobium]SDI54270.1 hypothetical protein SAMN05444163_3081 [Bradyrhizobium ottawaense]SED43201.1 hypothetical protein SAMN05444171_4088 [Bradyrhizobium lablabi]